MLVVGEGPGGNRALVLRENARRSVLRPGGLVERVSQQVSACRVEDDVEPQELDELAHGHAGAALEALFLLQQLVGLEQDARAVGVLGARAGVVGEARGELGRHHGGYEHDGEGHQVAFVKALERQDRGDKAEVVEHHGEHARQQGAGAPLGGDGGEQGREDVERDDARVGEAEMPEVRPDGGGEKGEAEGPRHVAPSRKPPCSRRSRRRASGAARSGMM